MRQVGGPIGFGLEVVLRLLLPAGVKHDPRWAIDYRREPVQAADGAID
jgi:hypothetical protein